MPQLVILVGPPGSGKTTRAKEVYPNHTRISQDDHGKLGHWEAFEASIAVGLDTVVDRMNFSNEQRAKYVELATTAGYEVRTEVLFVPRSICMARMVRRQDHPTIKTADDITNALNFFFRKFEYPAVYDAVRYEFADGKRNAVICDIDGTLANIDHRLHHVRGPGKKNWMGFMDGIPNDSVNEWCANIVYAMGEALGYELVYCSGRSEDTRFATRKWLSDNEIVRGSLFMRPAGDYRKDHLIKEIILDFEILPRYNVLFAIDDRQQVVDMWRRRGIVTLQCAKGNF